MRAAYGGPRRIGVDVQDRPDFAEFVSVRSPALLRTVYLLTGDWRYVACSGTRLVPITFAGSCGPSGEPISGTWTAYDDRSTGLLDCAAPGTASALAAKAAELCPKG